MSHRSTHPWDVVIVGGGAAGLSAALLLGRCRRRVCVFDDGAPRNARSHRLGGYLTRDGIRPSDFLRIAREQLLAYDSVEVRFATVVAASCVANGFDVCLADGTVEHSRKLLVATGLIDELPAIEGLEALYGQSVFHCAYCDGWEIRRQPIAVYATGASGAESALQMTVWTDDIVLCLNGGSPPPAERLSALGRQGIAVRSEQIVRLEGCDGQLERVIFAAGPPLARRALFFDSNPQQRSDLLERLGCSLTSKGDVAAGERQRTVVPGLYVAGDAARSVRLVIVAAAEGAEAAFDINAALLQDDLGA